MCAFRVTVSRRRRQERERHLHTTQQLGKVRDVTCVLAILAVTDGQGCEAVALPLLITPKPAHQWVRWLLLDGLNGLQRHQPPGRPPQRTKTQKHELAQLIEAGPVTAGFLAACWRSPLIPPLLYERLGVF